MGVEVEVITKPEYDGRQKVIDERFDRDVSRISKLEDIQMDMVQLNAQFVEFIKLERERVDGISSDVTDMKKIITQLQEVIKNLNKSNDDNDTRIERLENQPRDKYDRIIGWFTCAVIGAVVSYLSSVILH